MSNDQMIKIDEALLALCPENINQRTLRRGRDLSTSEAIAMARDLNALKRGEHLDHNRGAQILTDLTDGYAAHYIAELAGITLDKAKEIKALAEKVGG